MARQDQADSMRPRSDTLYKLEQLRALRQRSKRDGGIQIAWLKACELVGIDPKTVRRHDPELRRRWDDWEF